MQRLAAASGIGFVLFLVLSIVFQGGESPDFDAAATEWVEYGKDNADDMQLSAVFVGLAAFQFLWFAGYLRAELGRAEEAARGFVRMAHVVFAGAIAAAVGLVLSSAMSVMAASQPEGTAPDVVRALFHTGYAAFVVASVGLAAMLYTAAFLILRLRPLPLWLGWVALVSGLAYLLTLFVALDPADDGGAFEAFYPIGFLTLLVFTLATSIVLVRRVTPAAAA
jgi:hypothetical protein